VETIERVFWLFEVVMKYLAVSVVRKYKWRAYDNPDLMGSLTSMPDSNRDVSVVDELSCIAGNFFK